MSEDLLRLLEAAHPGRPRADLFQMIADTPDAKPAKGSQKPAQRRVGSRPRTAASMERRRRWAASGGLPPGLAWHFTLAETAVLALVAAEIAKHGDCTLTVGHIAAVVGVCGQTVRNAMRAAEALGLICVEVRRVSAWRNAPNRVTIVSPEWLSWLRLRRRGVPQNPLAPRIQDSRKGSESRSTPNSSKALRQAEGRVRWRETRF